ncbi:MAG: TRAM domain-containing protein [Acidobacteriota bacterium]|nr:TRAM domain-containing protein [Acidobacteriota bacterium]
MSEAGQGGEGEPVVEESSSAAAAGPSPSAETSSEGTPSGPSASTERRSAGDRLADLDELELTIDQLVDGGLGLGRYEGIPVFVARSAPGDRLRVRLVERKSGYGRAEIVEILEPGAGRREAPCPYFADCGGCDLQHLEDALQTRLKAQALLETLRRVGRLEEVPKIRVRAAQPWGYRLRTQLHTEVVDGEVQVGYHARGSNRLVPVSQCPILVPELEGQLLTLASRLPEKPPRRLDLAAGGDGALAVAPVIEGMPHGTLEMQVGELTYNYDARCFFQVHRGLVEALVEETLGPAEEDPGGDLAYDLYSGVGLFSLPLAQRYRRVVAVESDRVAARHARNNARHNKLPQVEVVSQVVERWARELGAQKATGAEETGAEATGAEETGQRPGRVIMDPPRSGLSLEVRQALLRLRPRHLTYVSCHPAALARDLRALTRHYRLSSLTVLDLFPQTGHIEAVAQLHLR